MKGELRESVAGGIAAINQAEQNSWLERRRRRAAVTNQASFDPVLHSLRHSNPVVHQLEKHKDKI